MKKVLVIAPAAEHERQAVTHVNPDTPEFRAWLARLRAKHAAAHEAREAENKRKNAEAWEGFERP